MRADVFGWFDRESETPAYDPGLSGKCPVCGNTLEKPVVTISLMPDKIRDRSYFFRCHKPCWSGLSEEEQGLIESSLIDEVCAAAASVNQ